MTCLIFIKSMNVGYVLVAVGSSGIFIGKQKLGVTFNFDKQDVIDFMNGLAFEC